MLSRSLNIEWWYGGKVHKISNHIYHLQRGEIFFLYGKSFLALGGADSHDKSFRKENESNDLRECMKERRYKRVKGYMRQVD